MKRQALVSPLVWLVLACTSQPPAGSASPDPSSTPAPPPSSAEVAPPPSATPATPPSASAAEEPAAPLKNPFSEPATPKNPADLSWLTHLVKTLAKEPATREHVSEFIGKDAGADTTGAGYRRVKAHSPYLEKVLVYPMPHLRIEVAMDMTFATNSRPGRSAIESALGPLQSMPAAPDAKGAGPKFAAYEKGTRGTVRVFVEFDRANPTQVASVHVDVDGASH
ncbi:MAG: hypothetical protein U0263_34685 [Polyangiaceae bacterium]